MPLNCEVKGCLNYDKKQKKRTNGITFHRFPTDPVRHEAWCRVIRKQRREPNFRANRHSRICSEHFKEDDFYSPGRRTRLKKSAIPSVKVQPPELHSEEKGTLLMKIEPHESADSQDHLNDSVKIKIEADASSNSSQNLNDSVVVKIEPDASDDLQDDLNGSVIVKMEPHASDDLNGPIIVKIESNAPDNNSQNISNDSVQVKIEDNSKYDLKDVDNSEIEPIFDTPLEAALKRKIEKYTSMNVAKTKKIKVIQRQNNRLMTRNKSLSKIIKELNGKGIIGAQIEAALGDTPELAAIYKLLR